MWAPTFKRLVPSVRPGIGLVAIMTGIFLAATAWATPELGDNCVGCHQPGTLPEGHPPVEGMPSESCSACHAPKMSRAKDRISEEKQDQDQGRKQRRIRSGRKLHAGALGVQKASVSDEAVAHQCVDCHDDMSVLPDTHPPTAGMKMENCKACHAPDGPLSLSGKIHADHAHYLAGVTCSVCHNEGEPTTAPASATDACLLCHGPMEKLIERSANTDPTNPHTSPHGPEHSECALCHVQHAEPKNHCAACHDFKFKLP